jgi:hypothetical protein
VEGWEGEREGGREEGEGREEREVEGWEAATQV